MIRTAVQPRWLALLALLLVLLYAFGRLGLWQLSLAQQEEGEDVLALQAQAAEPAVPLEEYLSPNSAFPDDGSGRPVSAQGRYVVADQFLVPQRYLEGKQGYWVVTPLQTSADARLPVLRGWVAEPGQADTPDSGPVTVTGTLAPAESPVQEPDLPPGQLGSVDLAVLANTWSGELYNAFVFATDEQPSVTGSAVTPVPPPSLVREGVDWRNLGYALQWWVFAGFAVFMYLRFLSDAAASGRAGDDAAAPHTVAP